MNLKNTKVKKFDEFVQDQDKTLLDLAFTSEQPLEEALITFGNKRAKYGNIVILAGGAGSGKDFVIKTLIGIEGKVLDVDEIKRLYVYSSKLAMMTKARYGVDLYELDLKDPDNVKMLHEFIEKIGINDAKMLALFQSITLAPKDRKPNLIFNVTMSDLKKLEKISRDADAMGYDKKNIHIVWVVTDYETAKKNNATRSRSVPEEILYSTHVGVATTVRTIIEFGDAVRKYMDGDIWIVFNTRGIDNKLIGKVGDWTTPEGNKASRGKEKVSGYLDRSSVTYVKIKKVGKSVMKMKDIAKNILDKIRAYIPKEVKW